MSPEAFSNNSSANVKLLKTLLHKIGKSAGFLNRQFTILVKAYIFGKTLVVSIICSKYENEGENKF